MKKDGIDVEEGYIILRQKVDVITKELEEIKDDIRMIISFISEEDE